MPEPSSEEGRQYVVELTEAILGSLAPDELQLLPEVSDEFFSDPDRALKGAREESLGFGIELTLLAPFALAVSVEVVKFLLSIAKDALGPDVQTMASGWMRRMFPKGAATADARAAASPLTREQLQSVRDVAHARARDLGVSEPDASALADAVVGGLALAHGPSQSP